MSEAPSAPPAPSSPHPDAPWRPISLTHARVIWALSGLIVLACAAQTLLIGWQGEGSVTLPSVTSQLGAHETSWAHETIWSRSGLRNWLWFIPGLLAVCAGTGASNLRRRERPSGDVSTTSRAGTWSCLILALLTLPFAQRQAALNAQAAQAELRGARDLIVVKVAEGGRFGAVTLRAADARCAASRLKIEWMGKAVRPPRHWDCERGHTARATRLARRALSGPPDPS